MHKITLNEASTISSHSHSHIRFILCCPVDKSSMQFILYSVVYTFLTMAKIYLPQFKYAKIHYHEIPSIGLNLLEFFCVLLYTEFLSDLHKKFQIASLQDRNVEYQI